MGTSRTRAVFVVSHAEFFLIFKRCFRTFGFKGLIFSGFHLASAVSTYVLSLPLSAGADAATQTPWCIRVQNHFLEWTKCLSHHFREVYGVNIRPRSFSLQWLPLLSAHSGLGNHNLSLPLLCCWPCWGGLTGGGVASFYISCCL